MQAVGKTLILAVNIATLMTMSNMANKSKLVRLALTPDIKTEPVKKDHNVLFKDSAFWTTKFKSYQINQRLQPRNQWVNNLYFVKS